MDNEDEPPRAAPTRAKPTDVGANGEGVRFWVDADKEGWMQSQGEHLKTWRKRW